MRFFDYSIKKLRMTMSIFLNLQLSASLKRQDHLITNFCNGGSIREQIFYIA